MGGPGHRCQLTMQNLSNRRKMLNCTTGSSNMSLCIYILMFTVYVLSKMWQVWRLQSSTATEHSEVSYQWTILRYIRRHEHEIVQIYLNPIGGRPDLPGVAVESVAAATVAANDALSTWGFKEICPGLRCVLPDGSVFNSWLFSS